MAELEEASRNAAEGLRLCLAGDAAAGLACYRACVHPDVAAQLPLGLHAHMMEEAGHAGAADALRRLAVGRGGDLAWRGVLPSASPEIAVAEYRELFARGFANPPMVSNFLAALTRLGRSDELAAFFDVGHLLHCVTIGGGEAVARALLAAEDGMEYGSRQVSRDMRHLVGLHQLGDPVFDGVLARCRTETAAYFARWAASGHPLAHLVPRDFSFIAWGMVARGEGHNRRHRHPVGWATGVYYPAGLPTGSVGGALCIGGWEDPAPPGWPVASIRPEPGLLVLAPSWYVHWTEPTKAEGPRLAIAFDAIPDDKVGRAAL